ncbi:MAG: Maf family protein [Phycisphaerales bacterium]|nr:Maf family protein [Phycisphaerales bacterium]
MPPAPSDKALKPACGRLVLASTSPRRTQLLHAGGLLHEVRDPGVDDGRLRPGWAATPASWVASLAYLKARAGAEYEPEDAIVLGADTICVHKGRVIGQPRDAREARSTLVAIEGGRHEVYTGVALVKGPWRDIFVDRAIVTVGELGPERIERYVASGEWRGKAGAYNLGERLAAGWPITFEGDPTTIVGLPMNALEAHLALATAEACA